MLKLSRFCRSLTHLNSAGEAHIVDISSKNDSVRVAIASARIRLGESAYSAFSLAQLKKGDPLTVSRIAGLQAVKETSRLIPLCHSVNISHSSVNFTLIPTDYSINVEVTVKSVGNTGVEMEAMTGASIAALSIYDMCKGVSKEIVIENVQLVSKTGGKSGDFKKN